MVQDKKGYYWIGTDNGLQRFDGKYFISLPMRQQGKTNESSGEVIKSPILEDKAGNIWGLNGNSISIYNPHTGKRDRLTINDDTINLALSDILHFCKDPSENIWIITNLNLYKYDYYLQRAVLWVPLPEMKDRPWRKIIYDRQKDVIWIAGGRDIICFHIKSKIFTLPFSDIFPNSAFSIGEYPIDFFLDRRQNLWFCDWENNVYKYNTINYQKNVYHLSAVNDKNNTVYKVMAQCIEEDDMESVMIGTSEGLFLYDENKDSLLQMYIQNKMQFRTSFASTINDIFTDNDGNIFTCLNEGIDVLTPSNLCFNNINSHNKINSFPNIEVTKIFEKSNGDIFVSTWGRGWYLYDKDFNQQESFYHHPLSDKLFYRKNMVWCFTEDPTGRIWIGYQSGLIGIYDSKGGQLRYIEVPAFGRQTIKAIECDDKGNIWFGLQSGFLSKWDAGDHKFYMFLDTNHISKAHIKPICALMINNNKEIWISTEGNGFYRFDPVLEKIAEIHVLRNQDSIPDDIFSLTQLNDSIIGVCTRSQGVVFFNEKQNILHSLTHADGILSNKVNGLAVDKQQNIWMVTNDGILRLNARNNKIVSFDEDDGVLVKDFSGNIVTLRDGRMVMPTTTGFVYFSPDNSSPIDSTPHVKITEFKIRNIAILIDSLLSNPVINLTYKQNFITISYSSLSFSERNTIQYSYQLVDINEDWINAGNEQSASYTDLSPGKYTFRVKCENRDGIPSNKTTELYIKISPPWWLSWWAYGIYGLMGVNIIYTLYRNRIYQIENKQAYQLKTMVATQEEERKRISRDLHDDIGTKLSALKLYLSTLGEKATAYRNGEIKSLADRSVQLITETMQDVRQLLLNLSPTVLEEFGYTTAVEGLVNKINETKQIHFTLVVFGLKGRLPKDYELTLYRITQELINNVLKHAQAKHVSLQIGQRDEKIVLMIEDDGVGFDVHSHKAGYGLNNLNSRTKLLKGTMTIDSMQGKGTSVLIEIPYHANAI